MQTVISPASGSIEAVPTLFGMDLHLKDEGGEYVATVTLDTKEAWELFRTLGKELGQ